MKQYTHQEKKYILSKVIGIRWEAIPQSLKAFWLEWKLKN